jgi:hypothetical protein
MRSTVPGGDVPITSPRRSETHVSLAGEGCPENNHRVCVSLYPFGNFPYLQFIYPQPCPSSICDIPSTIQQPHGFNRKRQVYRTFVPALRASPGELTQSLPPAPVVILTVHKSRQRIQSRCKLRAKILHECCAKGWHFQAG